jgi:hypothetical protein
VCCHHHPTWGVAPGYGEVGLRPTEPNQRQVPAQVGPAARFPHQPSRGQRPVLGEYGLPRPITGPPYRQQITGARHVRFFWIDVVLGDRTSAVMGHVFAPGSASPVFWPKAKLTVAWGNAPGPVTAP